MEVKWFRQDKPAVLEALRRGQRPLIATTMAPGPVDEVVALHIELGIFDALDALSVARQRDGIADPLLLRTLATLPFLPEPALDPAAKLLFQEPASCSTWGGRRLRSRPATINGIAIGRGGNQNRSPAIPTPCGTNCGGSRRRRG